MNIGRLIFYVFLAYVAYMLIGHIVQMNWQEKEKQQEETKKQAEQAIQQQALKPKLEELDTHMKEGLQAFRKGDVKAAEEHFHTGRELARSLGMKGLFNHFTIMLGNVYLDSDQLDKADTLLQEAGKQDDIDEISYNNQLVVLYEKQGKHKEMCATLATLKEKLASLDCEPFKEDIKILEAQEDDQKIMEIFKKPNIEAIVDCAGRRMIEHKMADQKCS